MADTTPEARIDALEKSIDGLTQKLTELTEANNGLSASFEKLQLENASLKTQLNVAGKSEAKKPEPAKIPEIPFTVNSKKYRFVLAKFRWKGQILTAMDAMADKSILKELVEKQSGVIKEVAE